MSTALAHLTVFLTGALVGGFAVPAGFAVGLSAPETYLAAALGGVCGAVAFLYLGGRIRDRADERKPRTRRRGVSHARRLADRFGAKGLGLVGPIFPGVTLSSLVGLSVGFPVRDLMIWLALGVVILYGLYTAGIWLLLEIV